MDVAINEIDRKLSMIDESSLIMDYSIEYHRNTSLRRSGSQGGGIAQTKTKRYREKISKLES